MRWEGNDYLSIEMQFAIDAQRQAENGWLVDEPKMRELILKVEYEQEQLLKRTTPKLPKRDLNKGELKAYTPPKKQFNMDGTVSAICQKWFDAIGYDKTTEKYCGVKEGETYLLPTPIDEQGNRVPLVTQGQGTLADIAFMKDVLRARGWKPRYWNEDKDGNKTSPKTKMNGIICPNLLAMEDELAKDYVLFLSMRHRVSLLKGLLKVIRLDGRIPSEMNTLGTATGRVSHRKIANFPNTESYLGAEIRECFIAEEGKVLISTDSDSCQLRMLAHYLIEVGGESIEHPYIQAILHGTKEQGNDAHCLAQQLGGLNSRSEGKTLNYSLLFGQGDESTGKLMNRSASEVKSIKKKFFGNVPALSRLMVSLEHEWNRSGGYIVGLDGRKIKVDSEHKLLNYLLQSAEAIYMKYVANRINTVFELVFKKKSLDIRQVCFYHDEVTHEIPNDESVIGQAKSIHQDSFFRGGVDLNIKVPMTGTPSVGLNWAEVH